MEEKRRGGARKGAGRPKSLTGRKKTMGITLSDADIELLKSLGGSRWIRQKLNEVRSEEE